MEEERRPIRDKETGLDYDGLYDITKSGRIISVKRNQIRVRCGDEYGFHIVKLSKDGAATNHNLLKLWRQAFPDVSEHEFKGAINVKYK